MAISTKDLRDSLKNIGSTVKNSVAEVLSSNDFISRTIGMNNSYEDLMYVVQSLGREPVSLLGKDFTFIFDHVRRIYEQGTTIPGMMYGVDTSGTGDEYSCAKFTFYKERPSVRFADVYNDPMNLLDRWMPDFDLMTTKSENVGLFYAESNDDTTNNKSINYEEVNTGARSNQIASSFEGLSTCDMIRKTNDHFKHGKYKTLMARFHTNSEDSKNQEDPTQTSNTRAYGMSHGRNLLKITPTTENGYNNPYCRVWTYHHQYNQMSRAIRPFGDANSAEELESLEQSGDYNTIGFRTSPNRKYGLDGGSKRLDTHGVLNYDNGFVNIAPTAKIKNYFDNKEDDKDAKSVSVKRCMFSIENLAWKEDKGLTASNEYDPKGLSAEQRGPFGGRIMWFPPYDLSFSEDVSVNWNSNQFIGRGEKLYTYTDTERRGNLSFTLLIDHPSILDYWTGHEKNGMKNQGMDLLPGNTGGVDEIYNQENTLLRFFAGCEILSAKPQEYWHKEVKPKPDEGNPDPPVKEEPEKNDPPVETTPPIKKKIYCVLYYPNNYSGKDDSPEFAIGYLMHGFGTQKRIDGNRVIDVQPEITETERGYEVNGNGISLVSWNTVNGTLKYGVISNKTEGVTEYITESDIPYGGKNVQPAKQIDSRASKGKDVTGPNSEWKYRRWFYRVDNDTTLQRLVDKANNYIDGNSHKLNSTGYDWVKNNIKAFNLTSADTLVSFADLYTAITGNKGLPIKDANVKLVEDVYNGKNGCKVTKVTFKGHNSSHGRYSNGKTKKVNSAVDAARNNSLSSNRALTFKKWMANMNFPMAASANASETLSETAETETHKNDTVDSQYIKAWRSASVCIEYEESQIAPAQVPDTHPDIVSTSIKNKATSVTPEDLASLDEKLKAAGIRTSSKQDENTTAQKVIDTTKEKASDEQNSQNTGNTQVEDEVTITTGVVGRYDNEGEFFELLDKNSPFLHHLITDKIKYFDPAFHSISPEGFNARLTFLHQCTRQGATVGNSDINGLTAYNLAFGRPPVCVLRIGDFFYTKIIINSLNIQYETPQWDLNPEGIGVMPMFAKVSMNFAFIGGSDLAGPIARLQNAVSFNYYANTGVYDDRAEMVEYQNGKEVKYKPYIYPEVTKNPEKKKKGDVDIEASAAWMNEFYKGMNVSNADARQTDAKINEFDRNYGR